MSGRPRLRPALPLVPLALLPVAAVGQVQLDVECRVQVQGGGVIVIQPAPGQADGEVRLRAMVAPPGAADDTIGDPWWDEAAGQPAAPSAAAEPVPADHGDQLRRLAREQAQQQRRVPLMTELRRELSVVRATCPSLEPAARARIVAAGRAEVAASVAAARAGRLGPAIAEAVRREATSAEAAAYGRHEQERAGRRRAAAIAVVVAAVDREVWLDEPQRRTLSEAIAKAWGPAWEVLVVGPPGRMITAANVPGELEACLLEAAGPEAVADWRRSLAEARPR